jgi:hypothetical protein
VLSRYFDILVTTDFEYLNKIIIEELPVTGYLKKFRINKLLVPGIWKKKNRIKELPFTSK